MFRKCFVLVLAAILALIPTAAAEKSYGTYVYTDQTSTYFGWTNNGAMLVSESGTILTDPGDYILIYNSSEYDPRHEYSDIFCYSSVDSYDDSTHTGYMDAAGNRLTDCIYDGGGYYPEYGRIIGITADYNVDVMDEQGNVLFSGSWVDVVPTSPDSYLAVAVDPAALAQLEQMNSWDSSGDDLWDDADSLTNSTLLILDANGNAASTDWIASIYGLCGSSDGVAPVLLYDERGDGYIYRYIGADGMPAFDGSYGYADTFTGSYAIATSLETGLYGLLNRDGSWALKPEYDMLSFSYEYENAPIFAQKGDASIIIYDNATLQPIVDYVGMDGDYAWGYQVNSGLLSITSANTVLLFDINGNLLCRMDGSDGYINGYYSFCGNTAPGAYAVTSGSWPDTSCSIYSNNGDVLCSGYQQIDPLVWENGHGLYNFRTFDIMEYDYEGTAYRDADFDSYRIGLMDECGNVLIPAEFEEWTTLSADRFWVKQGDQYGMIDRSGNWLCKIDIHD